MMNSKNNTLAHGQIVQLHHVENNNYLYSQDIALKTKFSFLKKNKSTAFVKFIVGTQPTQDVKNLWQVLRTVPLYKETADYPHNSTTINYDDCIQLRHFVTGRYLISDNQAESQITKQGEVSCIDESLPGAQQTFMLQRIDDPYVQMNQPNFVFDNQVHGNDILRLVNLNDNRVLHSHTSTYDQKGVKHLNEVTMYKNRDENDYWTLQIIDQQLLMTYKLLQPIQNLSTQRLNTIVNNQIKLILKSCLLGAALHSHERKYLKGSKEQEVTCRQTQPRDNNDWWYIKSTKDIQSSINLSKIVLFHANTENYLSSCTKYVNPSGKGLEVCCKKETNDDGEWQIIVINPDSQSSLPIEHPFLIKHTSTNQYLGVFQNPSSPSDGQFEVGLMKEPCHATMWQVEQQQLLESQSS